MSNLQIFIDEILSLEAHGYIYAGKLNNTPVMVRHYLFDDKFKSNQQYSYEILEDIFTEICLYEKFSMETDLILKPIVVFTEYSNKYIYFVTEYTQGGQLKTLISEGKNIGLKSKINILLQIAEIIKLFHSYDPQYLIYNLKSSKILLKDKFKDIGNNKIKLYDLNSISNAHEPIDIKKYTAYFLAPELIRGEDYDSSVDIFSFGVLIWEIFSRKIPFQGVLPNEAIEKIKKGEFLDINEVDKETPSDIKNVILNCFKSKKERVAIDDIIKVFNKFK